MINLTYQELPVPWQRCFELAWESLCEGSKPIGAVVVNTEGKIVSTGKCAVFNSLSDSVISHNELAHAEVNALLKLDNRVHTVVYNYTLYSTLEPCPLCLGALYMSGIKILKYAGRDRYGGSTNLLGTTPYLSRKRIQVHGPFPELEEVSIILNVYFDVITENPKGPPLHEKLELDYPKAVEIGRIWAKKRKLEDKKEQPFETIYPLIMKELTKIPPLNES